ncbi:Uncharacterised protein [Klebsiella variicola]|uniref:Uncharacterized protein n=1 Tax=Klebsiella variicola TaxID=244366 RepID=A0A7H4M9Q2_KLEVA|nr:Uncharacterised protein [Klebsiella variicola]
MVDNQRPQGEHGDPANHRQHGQAAGSFVAEQHRHQQQIPRQIHAVGDRRVNMLWRMSPQVTEGVIDKESCQQRPGLPLLA